MRFSQKTVLAFLEAVFLVCTGVGNAGMAAESTKVGEALRSASLDGTWSGTTKCLYDPGLWPEDICDTGWNISIEGSIAKIEMITKNKSGQETRSRVDDRPILVRRFETNAVLTTIEGGNDEDGHWVETWTFSISLKDKDHLLVHWNRIVNNTDFPLDKPGSKFSIVEMGELVRSAPAMAPAEYSGAGPTDASLDELFAVAKMDQLLDVMRRNFSASFRNGIEASLQGNELSPKKRQDLNDFLSGFDQGVARMMNWQTMRPIYLQVYRETFSREEVDGMIAFARSPAGRAQIEKMPVAMQKAEIAMKPVLQKMVEDIKAQASKVPLEAAPNH